MLDLHQHSTFSDGTDSFLELLQKNKQKGIDIMSVTDHDNIDAAKLLKSMPNTNFGMKYVDGIEFSTDYNGKSVHILVYGYDIDDLGINLLLEKAKKLRKQRIEKRLEYLKSEFGIVFDKNKLDEINNSDNPNKPMLANMLIKMGYGTDITEVIHKFLYHKMPNAKLSTQETIKMLKNSPAKVVLAHPLGGIGEKKVEKTEFEDRVKKFVDFGLDGLECYYSLYTKEEQQYLIETAKKYNLLISGGSDYHGKNKNVEIGELSSFGVNPSRNQLTILNSVKILNI